MKFSHIFFLTAAIAPTLALDTPLPSGFEIRLKSSAVSPTNQSAAQEPGKCPEGERDVGLVAGAPCFMRCQDSTGKEQFILREAGADCGKFLFFDMKCTAKGLCSINT
jgi:hypothetical protein